MIETKEKEHTKEPQMGLSFEKVWAMFQETDKKFAETRKLIEESAKRFEETGKHLEEVGKRIDKVGKNIDNLGKQLGAVDHRFGDVIEHLVVPDIVNKFNALGYKFTDSAKERKFKKEDGSPLAQVDIFLENGDYLMAVEVKAKPNEADVDDHVQRLGTLRALFDKRGDKRKLLGAIAGAVMNDNVCELALKNGLYVLKQSGETMKLLTPEGNPRMWLPIQ
jgi:hypothetical protein